MLRLRLLACFPLVPVLLACGEAPPGTPGPDGGSVAAADVHDLFASTLEFEIDEAVLADLLDAHGRVLAAGDALVPLPDAKVPGRSWTLADYGRVLIKWKVMKEAARGGVQAGERQLEQYRTHLQELRARAETAPDSERALLRQRIAHQEQTLATHSEHVDTLRKLSTPAVRALVAKWQPRFDELEARYDE